MVASSRLSYCTTPDGVRLAYCVEGRGPVVVKAAHWMGHVEREREHWCAAHWIRALAARNTSVRYDTRGSGLSDRDAPEISLDAWVRDLETVVDAAGVGRFVLLGISQGAAVAVRYAVLHPERVRGLVLFGSFARGLLRQGHGPKVEAAAQTLIRLAEVGWGHDTASFRQVFTRHIYPDASPELMQSFDELYRDTISGPMAARYMREFHQLDVRADAGRVACPTLVMHVADDRLVLASEGRVLASLIPGARYVELPGRNHIPREEEEGWRRLRDEMSAFLRALDDVDAEPGPPALTPRQVQVMQLVARGRTDKEIARALELSPRTVEMHVARALAALGSRNRADAVRKASVLRLLGPA